MGVTDRVEVWVSGRTLVVVGADTVPVIPGVVRPVLTSGTALNDQEQKCLTVQTTYV